MNKSLTALAVVGLLATSASLSFAETPKTTTLPSKTLAATLDLTAKVTAIDYKTRMVTLQGEGGKTTTMHVGPEARNFDQIKTGDTVHLKYLEAIALDVQRDTGTELNNESAALMARSPKGAMPAGVLATTTTLRASVESIDHATRRLTLVGPEGKTVTLKVGDEVKRFSEIKQGDKIVATLTEALAISVTRS